MDALQDRLEQLKGELGPHSGAQEMERLVHDLAVHQVELEMQNTELRASQHELAESRDRYADLYDFAPIGYLTFDRKGHIVDLNLAAAHMLGADRTRLTGAHFSRYLPNHESQPFYAHLRNALEADTNVTIELKLKGLDGAGADVRLESLAMAGPDGQASICRTAMMDITERRRAEDELKRSHDRLDELVQERTLDLSLANDRLRDAEARLSEAQRIAGIGSWENNLSGAEGAWSDECFRILGHAPQSIAPSFDRLLEQVHPDDHAKILDIVKNARPGDGRFDAKYRITRADGEQRLVQSLGEVVFATDGRPFQVRGTVQDITERQRVEDEQRQAETVFNNVLEGILILDSHGNITSANPAFVRITGYSIEEVTGGSFRLLWSDRQDEDTYSRIWASLVSTGRWEGELWIRRHTGEAFGAWAGITAIRGDAGRVANYVTVLADISLLKESQEQLAHLAQHDSLTGLANRPRLIGELDHALRRARRHRQKLAVLFLDLDHFKAINDKLGHETGDRLLQAVAKRLRDCVRAEDAVARLGGDEFVVVLDTVKQAEDAALLAGKITEAVAQPVPINGGTIQSSASIGISIYPDHADTVQDLLSEADKAMYRAKEIQRGTYQFVAPEPG